MENSETVYARWEVKKDQVLFVAILITIVLFLLFFLSAWVIYFVSQSTNIILLIVPIVLFLFFLGALPELAKSLKSVPEESEVYLTNRGVYRKTLGKEEHKFIPWGQMDGYDMSYLGSTSPLGKLFTRPTKFFLKSKYEEDNFVIEAFGEDVDIFRAYLKENNVPFGFLKNS